MANGETAREPSGHAERVSSWLDWYAEHEADRLDVTECPQCGQDADCVTATGYWYRGMTCTRCWHVFA